VVRPIGGSMEQSNRLTVPVVAGRDAGFLLVETLIAFAVLALSLSALFDIVSDGVRRTSQSEKLTQASLALPTLLARVGADIPLHPGQPNGQLANGLRWRMLIEPFGDVADQRAWPVSAYKVFVEVSWQYGSQKGAASATTLRLSPKEIVP
jgi:general secretion pathway protein I